MESKHFIDYVDNLDIIQAKLDLIFSLVGTKSIVSYKRRGKEGADYILLEISDMLPTITAGLMNCWRSKDE